MRGQVLVELLGHVVEWLYKGLQILPSQFDSGRGLQKKSDAGLSSKLSYFVLKVIILGL